MLTITGMFYSRDMPIDKKHLDELLNKRQYEEHTNEKSIGKNMQNRRSISNYQAVLLTISATFTSAVFSIPGQAVTLVKQDAWISVILSTILAIALVFYPLADLSARYPGKTLVQYSQDILGKYAGKFISMIFIYTFFQVHCWQIRQFGELANLFFPETPVLILISIFALIVAYAMSCGFEVIARSFEFVFPMGIIILIIIPVLSIKDLQITNLFPMMESSISKIFLASISPLDWLSIGFVFGVISGYVHQKPKPKLVAISSIVISGLLLTFFSLLLLMLMGTSIISANNYPFLLAAQFSGISGVFERMEAFFIPVWISWIFIKTSIFGYSTLSSLTQLLNFSDYRFLILPETLLAVTFSYYQYDSYIELSYFFGVSHFYYLSLTVGLPFSLWIIYFLKERIIKKYIRMSTA